MRLCLHYSIEHEIVDEHQVFSQRLVGHLVVLAKQENSWYQFKVLLPLG